MNKKTLSMLKGMGFEEISPNSSLWKHRYIEGFVYINNEALPKDIPLILVKTGAFQKQEEIKNVLGIKK